MGDEVPQPGASAPAGTVVARIASSGLPVRFAQDKFWLESEGELIPAQVHDLDARGRLVWADDAARQWFASRYPLAGAAPAMPGAASRPVTQTSVASEPATTSGTAPVNVKTVNSGCLYAMLIVLMLCICGILGTCGSLDSATRSNPALAAKVHNALASAGGAAAIHDVTAEADGKVIVTLTLTKAQAGSDVQAEDDGKTVAQAVLVSVPEVTQVSVFDANHSLIDIFPRK